MEFLAEDPTYLAGGLAVLAGGFLLALKLTQQGRYLIWAGVALALALVVVVVERVWVTDNERVEEAVYALGRAVAAADAPDVLDRLTPDVQYVVRGLPMPAKMTRDLVEQAVANAHFDFLRITNLRAHAGEQSRRGTADFLVLAGGSIRASVNDLNFATHNSSWSLGFRETSPGVWKVNSITPVSVPGTNGVIPVGDAQSTSPAITPRRR